ncbi:hypothetical protein L915_16511 [Phytophthora nicotianae]|nr:hypothetical protein L915_16511 [Phytophthora nicotianae]
MDWLGRWAVEERPLEYVAKQLKVLGKTDDELKFLRNYNAIKEYPAILKKVQLERAKHWAKLNQAKTTRS